MRPQTSLHGNERYSVGAGVGQPQDCVRVNTVRHCGTGQVAHLSATSVTVGQPESVPSVSTGRVTDAVKSIGSNEYRSDVVWAAIGVALELLVVCSVSAIDGAIHKNDGRKLLGELHCDGSRVGDPL
ncbi:hypothetical protein CSPAE12_03922 [Colletotrichum incanum]|nr:hypothetical protein CSPAE12_03922 [Colletotrichum incanum]